MTVISVPELEEEPWPTLGPQVCAFIEANLCFGPGDLRGLRAKLDDEKRALIYRCYEVYPKGAKDPNGKDIGGRRRFRRVALSLQKGTAKALALGTPLPTPDGWTTIGDVQVGDLLFDERGQPCPVVATSEVFVGHRCYAVAFRDGSAIVADAGHRWYTEELRREYQHGKPYVGSIKTTEEIAGSLTFRADKARNHRIPVSAPLQLDDQELPIDPYVLGYWLGDGRADDAEFTVHASDLDSFREQVAGAGYHMAAPKRDSRRPQTLAIRVSISPIGTANNNGRPTLKGELRRLGLLDNKHVPSPYLRAGLGQRLALLQGLMDSDGTAAKNGNGQAFVSTTRVLAEAAQELACSLGLKPSLRPTASSGRPAWKVYFHAHSEMPVFRLPRKRERQIVRPHRTPMSTNRHIVACSEVPSVPTRCIAVDSPSHLFLAGRSMIPTHNTELAAWIAAVELHPEGPVRCDGFDSYGRPVGRPVIDPYIPMVAYTEEQADDLAYSALKTILELSPVSGAFDIGLERIMRAGGDGKAVALAGAPDARDGARTTFQHLDETHRWTLNRLRRAHQTMLANLPKRWLADPWELETTTAYSPGEHSVAELTADYAKQVQAGTIKDSHLFFFHRQASDGYDLSDPEQLRQAVVEAAGPTAPWRDIEGICGQWQDPAGDKPYLERVYLNRPIATAAQAFNSTAWAEHARPDTIIAAKEIITLGFDGSIREDATALIATHVKSGFQWPVGIWEKPPTVADWEVPKADVDAAVALAFTMFEVWRMYADPSKWDTWLSQWAGRYGEKKVVAWPTTLYRKMAAALKAYAGAIEAGEVTNSGDPAFARHIGNAQRLMLNFRDDDDSPLWLIQKDRRGSPNKIDAAMAGCLSWRARLDAIASGALNQNTWHGIFIPEV